MQTESFGIYKLQCLFALKASADSVHMFVGIGYTLGGRRDVNLTNLIKSLLYQKASEVSISHVLQN